MKRIDSVRTATGTAKESVKHTAETCADLAHQAKERYGPRVADMAHDAKHRYDAHVGPHVTRNAKKIRSALPEEVDRQATIVAMKTRRAAVRALPKVVAAAATTKAAAGPISREAKGRSLATVAALRGQVSPDDLRRIAKKRHRAEVAGRTAKGAAGAAAVAGAGYAAYKWWDRQMNPDWLVEPPEATEVKDDTEYMNREARVDMAESGTTTALDPEVQAKEAESEAGDPTDTSRAYYERGEEN
ncbi:DUF5324 family protein [Streptomyces sp. A7024]|uniref:DUF5324 family protein n=1 Tax=Streptomyces coryli TaxID=1128680 RepID=A0A6G4TXZ4_9ACTN|nr:DUF5324 family protein [Streptomyces coryli]